MIPFPSERDKISETREDVLSTLPFSLPCAGVAHFAVVHLHKAGKAAYLGAFASTAALARSLPLGIPA